MSATRRALALCLVGLASTGLVRAEDPPPGLRGAARQINTEKKVIMAFMYPTVTLHVLADAFHHSAIRLSVPGSYVLGRGRDCDVRVPADGDTRLVSRRHCVHQRKNSVLSDGAHQRLDNIGCDGSPFAGVDRELF